MTIPEIIYQRAIQEGFTKEAACALLANIQAESAFRSDNAEDRIHSSGISDMEYTSRADLGLTTFAGRDFVHDAVGYGYAQWTFWSRKQKLLAYANSRGCSVSESNMQIDFLFMEMKQDFSAQWNRCRTEKDLSSILRNLIDVWENPADHDGAYRTRWPMALAWFEKFSNWITAEQEIVSNVSTTDSSTGTVSTSGDEYDSDGNKIEKTWPPRTIDKGLDWKEVKLLECLLRCHGYNIVIDGIFEDALEKKVKKFQEENGLASDGVVGPKTWRKLMELPSGF